MPIRTNRGRAAVYRKLWAWPLRSPRHLVLAGVLLLALAALVGWLVPKATSPLADSGTRPSVTLSDGTVVTVTSGPGAGRPAQGSSGRPTRSTTSPVPRATTPVPSSAAAAQEALDVALAWARAWVNHPAGMTNEEWVAQLRPLTTEEFLPQLTSVDPVNIPSTAVVGQPEPVSSSAGAVEATVATDGALLRLTVIATESGWRVSAFNRVD
jgi:hypothetical protein